MIKRIVIVEDRKIERDSLARLAEPYGTVETAETLEEAQHLLRRGPAPGLILSDLHLHDGLSPAEVAGAIYRCANLNSSRLVFMTSDLGDEDLVRAIRQQFPSIRLIQKSNKTVADLLRELREDESGHLVDTMDAHSTSSHETIRKIVKEHIEDMLLDLGITWFDVKTWVRAHLRSVRNRDRVMWTLGLLVAGGLVMAIAAFVGSALIEAAREELRP